MRVRRRWAERHPAGRRRLARPVISVGNLSMGGTGKSPVVAAIAEWLIAHGERPAILSRGYARADAAEGVVVVSDGTRVLAPIERAGDEPLMLARQVPGAIVCVSADRHLAGTLAERRLGCTVHLLDDGFQHIELARNLDILVTTLGEIPQGRVIPIGRLREPMDAASRAHVLVVSGATAGAAAAEAWTLGVSLSCGATRVLGAPVAVAGQAELPGGSPIAVAGIANPERFFDSLRDAGWSFADAIAFPDHHRYCRADVERIDRRMKACGAPSVVTTDKDAVRFEALGSLPFPLFRVPLTVQFDPPHVLVDSVRAVLA
ncbi:MAG: tetraacyldisaccharide 4'-kinase [Acidobacteria bacterium RIFCSPLOWO2_12_FULL_67_14b]|nr:MAG: tetraacyldisaccharide 4'-kinase [Acidobacteria bacterium RIFCSPLOWO2_12_FULL_67_14b]